MSTAICKCGHEKRDHRLLPLALQGYGECKVCLCNAYTRLEAADFKVAVPAAQWSTHRNTLAWKYPAAGWAHGPVCWGTSVK